MITRLRTASAIVFALATSVASASYGAKSTAMDKDPVIAIVNGQSIHLSDLYEQLPPQLRQGKIEEIYPEFLPQVVDSALLVDAAIKEGLVNDPAVKKDIKTAQTNARNLILQRYYLKAHLKEPTEAEIKDHHGKLRAELSNMMQYQVKHILFTSDKDPDGSKAKKVQEEIQKGASFEELAKQHSGDTLSAPRGGDIGWVRLEDLPSELAEEVSKLKDGQRASAPVKTTFGWHIVERVASKKVELPSLEDDQVKLLVRLKMMDEFMKKEVLGKLRKDAKIQLFDLEGKPLQQEAKN
jgi:peptidyl-prolyl cis-trans isomerase C